MTPRPVRASAALLSLLAAAVLSAPPVSAELRWRRLPTSPINNFRHDDVFFLDASLGWVVNTAGFIYRTENGGQDWETLLSNPDATFRCVGFADAMNGWVGNLTVAASCFGAPGDSTLLYRTTDGGASWASVDNIAEPRPMGLCGMWVHDANTVYVVGRVCDTPRVIRSTDGGVTWTTFDLSAHADRLIDCYFPGSMEGFIVGGRDDGAASSHGVVLHTTDGGESWTNRHTTAVNNSWCWKISFPSATVGYVSVQSNGAQAYFLKSTDGGVGWAEYAFPPGPYFEQGIGFVDESTGWIGGSTDTWETRDGGVTWTEIEIGTPALGDAVNRFRFLTPTLGYAVGTRVYRYSDDLVTDAPLPDAGAFEEPRLIAAARPNPFRSHTDVSFTVPADGPVRLAVYDVMGKQVAELVKRELPAGVHEARFPAGELAAGVYVVRLETPGAVDHRKIQLVR